MKSSITKFFALLGLSLLITSAHAQDLFAGADDGFGLPSENSNNEAKATILSSVTSAAPGKSFEIAIELDHPGEWHSYYKNAGGPSIPLSFELTLPEGYTQSQLLWPVPHVKWVYDEQNYMYEGKAYFITTITVPADAKVGSEFSIESSITTQLCNADGCLPPNTVTASKTLKITEAVVTDAATTETINKSKSHLPVASDKVKFTTKVEGQNFLLNIETSEDLSKLEKPIFITDVPFTDNAKRHVLTKTDTGYTLTIPLKEDAKVPANITGIFTAESHLVQPNVHGFLVGDAGAKADEATKESSGNVFDSNLVSDEKRSLIDLSRLDDQGNVLDDNGKIIPPNKVFADSDRNLITKDGSILSEKVQTTFLLAVALIFAGGVILNLMPCVFPVLGVKVLGFVQLSGNDPGKIKKHGLVFTLGVIVSMWILAAVILGIKASTGNVAWGDQMKNPYFVGSMAILLTLFAMNLFGIFEVGTSLTGAGGNLQSKKGYQGSFFSGILTTLIATPCGAPLLATAMSYTLQQTTFLAMVLFTVFGLGVAFPYLLLAFMPKLIDKLPRPGAWMVTFKKSMAFPLFATVAFLLTVFIKQTGTSGITWMLWALVTLATAAFVYGTWSPRFTPTIRRYILGFFLSIALATCGGYFGYQAMTQKPSSSVAINHEWTAWKPNIIDQTIKKNRIVWVDYTADW